MIRMLEILLHETKSKGKFQFLTYTITISKYFAKIYLYSTRAKKKERKKEISFANREIYPRPSPRLRILSSKTTTSIHPTSYPAIETLLITLDLASSIQPRPRSIYHRRYKNSTITVVESEEAGIHEPLYVV